MHSQAFIDHPRISFGMKCAAARQQLLLQLMSSASCKPKGKLSTFIVQPHVKMCFHQSVPIKQIAKVSVHGRESQNGGVVEQTSEALQHGAGGKCRFFPEDAAAV